MFLFKQKTAYERRISDWSSDVCSSDLSCIGSDGAGNRLHPAVSGLGGKAARPRLYRRCLHGGRHNPGGCRTATDRGRPELGRSLFSPPSSNSQQPARKRVVSGKSVSIRVDRGGRGIINKQNIVQ